MCVVAHPLLPNLSARAVGMQLVRALSVPVLSVGSGLLCFTLAVLQMTRCNILTNCTAIVVCVVLASLWLRDSL
jgi:hypothetical protein